MLYENKASVFSFLSETKTKVGNKHPSEAFTLEQKSKSWVNFLLSPEKLIFFNPDDGTQSFNALAAVKTQKKPTAAMLA